MSPKQIAALKKAALAASPGRWAVRPFDPYGHYYADVVNSDNRIVCCIPPGAAVRRHPGLPDQAFIAQANPVAILELIAALETARDDREERS